MVGKWVNGEVEVQATNDSLQSANCVLRGFCTSRCTEKVQNTGTAISAKPPRSLLLQVCVGQSYKQAHPTAAIINTDHIRNCMDRPGTWLSEVSIPLIKNMYVSVRDMFYFNE